MAKYVKTEQGYIDASIFAPAPFKPEGKSYLTFSSPKSFTLKVNNATKNWDGTLEYFSADKVWTVWDGTTILFADNNDGEYVLYLRGTGNTKITGRTANGASDTYRWVLTGSDIACVGNIENLLDYATVESGQHPTMAEACYVYMFFGCTSLTQAPTLTATTLADYCYCGMFVRCTSLTQAPVLPAITLSKGCYQDMFFGCTSLTQAPTLTATTLADYCYADMFYGCTSLTQAPALSATTLSSHCYHQMFSSCTSLTQTPALPATTLANDCYYYMFHDCTSLTKAPALPATTLAKNCYYGMFSGCTSLTQVPALPATTLVNSCYQSMFSGCTSLKLSSTKTGEYTQEYRTPTTGTGTIATDALTNMFASTGGTFTGTPAINTTYYLSTDNMIVRDTEVATLNGYVGSMIDAASVQPDWNQNDETAADYVKNRPFYEDVAETVLLEESILSFTNPEGGFYYAAIPTTIELTAGETYKVSWDGATYECVCESIMGGSAIGNPSIMNAGADTGDPFLICPIANNNGTDIYTRDASASHTISISVFAGELVKIDAKYLPVSTDDSYGVVKKSDIVSAYSFSGRAPHDQMVDAITAFNTGNASIVWDGKKVIGAYYDSSADTISVTFAQGPLKLLTYSNNDGWYVKTLGTATYGEIQGSQVRITNDNGVYTVLATEGISPHETLNVSAEKILIRRSELSSNALILGSSTENSSKRFKITVDDSGAITATEVT